MTSDEFRKHGHELIDWIASYMDNVADSPVYSMSEPGAVRSQLPADAPIKPESFDDIMSDVEKIIMPGITHWQSPSFFAYFPANASPPSILGELLSAGLGVQGMLWSTSPACTELETHVMDWLVAMMGLPNRFHSSSAGGGVIQDTASSASLTALIAARERATGFASNEYGVAGNGVAKTGSARETKAVETDPDEKVSAGRGRLVAYVSNQAHSSLDKAMKIAGLGSANLRHVPIDESFAMDADKLSEMIRGDIAKGLRPFFVCATIGTTSTGAIDPIRRVGEIANKFGLWMHVDAAYAGSASVCPEFRHHQDGLELADSYTFNPHKWLLTNFDCNCFFVADRSTLIKTFSILPEYLRNKATEMGSVIDYRDWHIQLGRRFRALKLWFVIRSYGVDGLRAYIRSHVSMANEFADWVRSDEDWDIVAPVHHSLVCLRHNGGDQLNEQIMNQVNKSGDLFLTHTKLHERFTLRMAIGARLTTIENVRSAWHALRSAGHQLKP